MLQLAGASSGLFLFVIAHLLYVVCAQPLDVDTFLAAVMGFPSQMIKNVLFPPFPQSDNPPWPVISDLKLQCVCRVEFGLGYHVWSRSLRMT